MGTQERRKMASLKQNVQRAPLRAIDSLEAVTWLFVTSIYFTWYNPIGELGKARDTGDSILQRIDDALAWTSDYVPYVPEMIFPYVLVYLVPLAASRGLDMGRVRTFFITQMAMITFSFIVYYFLPCKTDILWNEELGKYENFSEATLAGRLCVKFVHRGISLYV